MHGEVSSKMLAYCLLHYCKASRVQQLMLCHWLRSSLPNRQTEMDGSGQQLLGMYVWLYVGMVHVMS